MRAHGRAVTTLLLIVFAGTTFVGCLRREFPERRQYVLSVERTAPARAGAKTVIKVGRVRAEPQYERKGFVYRTGEATYTDDFYNAFYVSPAQMVRSTMHDWLAACGLFATVAEVDSLVGADWHLESRLVDFYVDKRTAGDERAVVRLAVTLVDARTSPPRAAFERTYEDVASAVGSGRGYVDAWSAALAGIFERIERDLAVVLSSRRAP